MLSLHNKKGSLNTKTIFLIGGFFIWGIYTMKSNKYNYYGVVGGELQIKASIKIACNVINPSNAKESELLLSELIAVESDNGNATDYSPDYGEGLTQFDRPTFESVKAYFLQSRFKDLLQKIKTYCLVDVANATYEDLRVSPMLSIVMARLLFYKLPHSIPADKYDRWLLYKKYFNSELGATTQDKYYLASNNAVFKVA